MELLIYRNKRNENKYLEIHKYKCSHYRLRQFIFHAKGDVITYRNRINEPYKSFTIQDDIMNYTGGAFHRKRKLDSWKVFGASRKTNNGLKTLLEDYELVDKDKEPKLYDAIKKWKGWSS